MLTTQQLSRIYLPLAFGKRSLQSASLYEIINSYLKLFPTNKIVINSSAPAATATADAGAQSGGTDAVVTISGNKYAGTITLTTGAAVDADDIILSVDLKATAPTRFIVQLTPASTAAAAEAAEWFVEGQTNGFDIVAGATGLTAETEYIWDYTAHVL